MSLGERFRRELARLGLPAPSPAGPPISAADLAPLPAAAQRYLRFMGVVGRPRDRSLRLGFSGRFKVGHGAPWRPCEVWQYDTGPQVTRTFMMRMRLFGMPVIGRDTYRDGHGRMIGKVFDRVTVIDGQGPEFDVGELVTYLNDLVLLAPSMLLVPAVRFTEVDDRAFELSLTDHDHTVTARVLLDERGAPVDFETSDRFCEDPRDRKRMLRARWTTPVDGLEQRDDGRRIITHARAVWHLPQGPHAYADFTVVPGSVAFNVPPGA